jgi:hypothetical protein
VTNGTDLIKLWRQSAEASGKSMFVGRQWKDNRYIGFAIWLHKPGIPRKDSDIVATASNLNGLYHSEDRQDTFHPNW